MFHRTVNIRGINSWKMMHSAKNAQMDWQCFCNVCNLDSIQACNLVRGNEELPYKSLKTSGKLEEAKISNDSF